MHANLAFCVTLGLRNNITANEYFHVSGHAKFCVNVHLISLI